MGSFENFTIYIYTVSLVLWLAGLSGLAIVASSAQRAGSDVAGEQAGRQAVTSRNQAGSDVAREQTSRHSMELDSRI
jgi:hypothetical protein